MFIMLGLLIWISYTGTGRSQAYKPNTAYLSRPREGHLFDHATMRLETLSSFDFGPKKVFASLTSAPTCPLPTSAVLVSTGPDLWCRSSPVTAWSLAILNKSDAVQTSLSLLKSTKSIKPPTTLRIHTVQHVSFNMQSHPHDTSHNYSYYQRHHQTSLPPAHTPNYIDHNGQPMGYHPVAQNAQVQRSTYGHPQDPHQPGMGSPYPS